MINTRSRANALTTSTIDCPDFSHEDQQEYLGQCYKYLRLVLSSSSIISEVVNTLEVLVITVIWLQSESLDSIEIVEDLELSGKLLTTDVATCAKDGYSED